MYVNMWECVEYSSSVVNHSCARCECVCFVSGALARAFAAGMCRRRPRFFLLCVLMRICVRVFATKYRSAVANTLVAVAVTDTHLHTRTHTTDTPYAVNSQQ